MSFDGFLKDFHALESKVLNLWRSSDLDTGCPLETPLPPFCMNRGGQEAAGQ